MGKEGRCEKERVFGVCLVEQSQLYNVYTYQPHKLFLVTIHLFLHVMDLVWPWKSQLLTNQTMLENKAQTHKYIYTCYLGS